jgi:hypothetical protein
MTRADRRLLVILAGVLLLSIPLTAIATATTGGHAVLRGPHGDSSIDLSADGRYVVEGRHGPVVFAVNEGVLRCVDSTCPDRLCVRAGALAAGRPIVCAPNGVTAAIADGGEGLDAVSR